MKSLHNLARMGAVLLAVSLLGGYVYVKSGGTLWSHLPAAAGREPELQPESVAAESISTAVDRPLVPIEMDESKEAAPVVLGGSKSYPAFTTVPVPIASQSKPQVASPPGTSVMPSSKYIPLSPEVIKLLEPAPA